MNSISRTLVAFSASVLLAGCAGRILQHEKAEDVLKVDEYEQKVEIKEVPVDGSTESETKATADDKDAKSKEKKKSTSKDKAGKEKRATKDKKGIKTEPGKTKGPREPKLEDSVGFEGRRPIVDPFRPGEKVTFDVSYFNITAGTITMEVKPFVEVNGQKAYNFELNAKTNGFFARIYSVEDKAVTFLSYDELIPLSLQISIKESKQLAETRTYFDWKTLKANYWQKRITKDKGERSKKLEWDIKPYSQNVISAAYYLRTFDLKPGKKLAFRVADEGKNLVFTGEVLRRETLKTDVGTFKTVVVKPQVTVDGVFKPMGEILVWLTDDDRKFIVRLESKIKIGTIVGKLKALDKGRD
ncbi:MAG: DUF3108 domain-containing protein [Bdellovibrionales bacterium]